jgi:hypothetical protein
LRTSRGLGEKRGEGEIYSKVECVPERESEAELVQGLTDPNAWQQKVNRGLEKLARFPWLQA